MAERLAQKLVAAMGGLLALACGRQLIVFIISMLPILELRGGLIAASLLGLSPAESYILCIIGNVIPIPFILWLFNSIYKYMQKSSISLFRFLAQSMHKRIEKHRGSIEKLGFWGLVLFVGIPLPGTGAWTGCMIASVLEMDRKRSMLAALLGVFIASIIMMIVSFGIIGRIV